MGDGIAFVIKFNWFSSKFNVPGARRKIQEYVSGALKGKYQYLPEIHISLNMCLLYIILSYVSLTHILKVLCQYVSRMLIDFLDKHTMDEQSDVLSMCPSHLFRADRIEQ